MIPPEAIPQPPTDHFTAVVAAVSSVASVIGLGAFNFYKGRTRESAREGELGALKRSIEKSLDRVVERLEAKMDHHQERTEERIEQIHGRISSLREHTDRRVDEVDACIEAAQREATEALHASVGVNGQNGNRGDIRRIELELAKFQGEVRGEFKDLRKVAS